MTWQRAMRGWTTTQVTKPPYDQGVLLVHGIGSQRQGATVQAWCDAIVDWFELASGHEGNAEVTWADLAPADGPAHMTMRVVVNGTARNWLVAEAWWAKSFATPTFAELARWSVEVLPWTLITHTIRAARRQKAQADELERRMLKLPRVRARLARAGTVALNLAWAGLHQWLVVLIGIAVTPVLLVLLAAMTLLGLIPVAGVRNVARRVQLLLARTIGDSLVVLESPVQASAIAGVVRRDLAWVDQRCATTAMIAHSQGAAVTVEALSARPAPTERGAVAPQPPDKPVRLVTVGAGINKLTELATMRRQRGRLAVRVAGLAAVLFAVASVVIWRQIVSGAVAVSDITEPALLLLALTVSVRIVVGGVARARADAHDPRMTRREVQGLLDLIETDSGTPAGRLSPAEIAARSFVVLPASTKDVVDNAQVARAKAAWSVFGTYLRYVIPVVLVVLMPVGYGVGTGGSAQFIEPVRAAVATAPSAFVTAVLLLACAAGAMVWLLGALPHQAGPQVPASVISWLDLYAVADPVPNGPLAPPPQSTRVHVQTACGARWLWPRELVQGLADAVRQDGERGAAIADDIECLLEQVRAARPRARRQLARRLRRFVVVDRDAAAKTADTPGNPRGAAPRQARSVAVHNTDSIIGDHVGYRHSHDSAMLRLIAFIAEHASTPLLVDPANLDDIAAERRRRIRVLKRLQVSIALLALAAFIALHDTVGRLGTRALDGWATFVADLPFGLDEALAIDADGLASDLAGVGLLLAAAVVVGLAVRAVWSSWDRSAAAKELRQCVSAAQ